MRALTQREALQATAVLLALVKAIQFALDSQALFFPDSGAFILNGLGLIFQPVRSYAYGGLLRIFAVPFHSLRAIVAMQAVMGGLTAWLLAFALLRFLHVRPWIAILAALAFAMDPVQVVYEHMVMTEAASVLAMAVFLAAALEYSRSRSVYWLAVLAFLGILQVSLRLVYLPVVVAAAVLLPLGAWYWPVARRPRLPAVALALAVSCGATFLFQDGYRDLTGWLAHREPAYHYMTGFFLLATVSPIVKPGDTRDERVAQAVAVQSKAGFPLLRVFRADQLWAPEGLVARLKTSFGGDERAADQAAGTLAVAAVRRNPAGFLWLGMLTYLDYWRGIPKLRWSLEREHGTFPPHVVRDFDAARIASVFHADVSNQEKWRTLARRYHIFAWGWYVFLLLAPILTGLAWWLNPEHPQGPALLFFWTLMLLAATCVGSPPAYRYLHPFSFIGLAASAILCEELVCRRSRPRATRAASNVPTDSPN